MLKLKLVNVLKISIGKVIRPPDIVVGGLRFYRDSILYLSSFFVSYPRKTLDTFVWFSDDFET